MKLKLINKKAFDKLTVRQKRVALARNVIFRLKKGLINASVGSIFPTDLFHTCRYMTSAGLQKFFNENNCQACAKGGLLASWIGNFDSFSGLRLNNVGHYGISTGFPKELTYIFSARLLNAIEYVFEAKTYPWIITLTLEEKNDLKVYFPHDGNDSRFLISIFANIVKNKGVLKTRNFIFD